jgi:hypothetical protein
MKKIYFLTSFAIISFFTISGVSACSCLPPAPPAEAMKEVDAVFIGVVSDVSSSDALNVTATFTVSGSYGDKGLPNELEIVTARDSAACGINFEDNKEYLVYATIDGEEYYSNLCSRTTEISYADEDITALNSLVENEEIEYFTYSNVVGEPSESSDSNSLIVVLGLLLVLGSLGVLAYFGYKKR